MKKPKYTLFMRFLVFLLVFIFLKACTKTVPDKKNSFPVSHQILDQLLKKHVDEKGFVNYGGLNHDRPELDQYLELLSENPPNDLNWTREEQIAYWINAYNAFTLALVLDYMPLTSIKDIGASIQIPFVNTPWDIKFISIGGEEFDLNDIEHGILRKKWNEPRIHFAINCASLSCPKLRNEAYWPETLKQQLDQQAYAFINDDFRNDITPDKASISKIFRWYKWDFEEDASLVDFINKYADQKISGDTKIEFREYNWNLNSATADF